MRIREIEYMQATITCWLACVCNNNNQRLLLLNWLPPRVAADGYYKFNYITMTEKDIFKITKVYPVQKSTSSSGNYSIMLDIEWPNGLRANTFMFYFGKEKAARAYYKFLQNIKS